MQRKLLITTLLIFILGLASFTVLAGFFPSFGGSNNNTITYTVITHGDFDSFGIRMWGDLSATCLNPKGKVVPGQNKVRISGYNQVVSDTRERGDNTYALSFPDPLTQATAGAAGCPNGNWRVSRLTGWLFSSLDFVEGANGSVKTLSIKCWYDSSILGPMNCQEI